MNGIFRALLLGFFATHIPITLLVDMQSVFGAYYPAPIRNLFLWYGRSFNDPLMNPDMGGGDLNKWWLHSFIYAETLFQLPFFFFAVSRLYSRNVGDSKWRVWSLIYGIHTATTVLPIEAVFLASEELSGNERLLLMALYAPYMLIPLALAIHSARGLLSSPSHEVTSKKAR